MKGYARLLLAIILLTLLSVSCKDNTTSSIPTTSNPPTSSSPTTTATPITTINSPVNTTTSVVATFDFDSSLPALSAGKGTPFDQVSEGVMAQFSSPADPAAFSVQNRDTTFLTLSQFGGNYLYQNSLSTTKLYIGFSQPLISIKLSFATVDSHGVGEIDLPTSIKVIAYMDSTDTIAVGVATARGEVSSDSYPQGMLSFNSENDAFNVVVIELVHQLRGATVFLVDNIIVTALG